jgi:hypothetical protein
MILSEEDKVRRGLLPLANLGVATGIQNFSHWNVFVAKKVSRAPKMVLPTDLNPSLFGKPQIHFFLEK